MGRKKEIEAREASVERHGIYFSFLGIKAHGQGGAYIIYMAGL